MIKVSDIIIEAIRKQVPLIKENKIPKGFIEALDMMFKDSKIIIDRERLNILLSFWSLPPMSVKFFERYLKTPLITEIDRMVDGLEFFIKDALWHFGDLKRAYEILSEEEDIDFFFNQHEFHIEEFKNRLPWHLVEEIKPEDRGFLGYVSGQRPKLQKELLPFADLVVEEIESDKKMYERLSNEERIDKIIKKLSEKDSEINSKITRFQELSKNKDLDLFSAKDLESTKQSLQSFRLEIEETLTKVDSLLKIGNKNQEHYLRNIESIDVYVATSMRNDDEYLDMYHFVNDTFNDEYIKDLNLRYFDPTLCYRESRIDKGIIECLLVRSTKVTIYCAQDGDTFGKDSELAATLAQGKPVIVYVPQAKETDSIFDKYEGTMKRQEFEKRFHLLENRAKTFKDFHPLGIQVGLYDGVARGVIVVRTPQECSKVLYKILTNTLDVTIGYEEHGIVLRENETQSIVRVMTGWGVLSSCFWNQFSKTQNPKSGLPI